MQEQRLSFHTLSLTSHLRRFTLGSPLLTDALVKQRPEGDSEAASIPDFTHHLDGDGIRLRMQLAADDRVFGLGQVLGSLNRRGKRYRLFAKDDPSHTPDKPGLYGSHPFLMVQGAKTIGIFIDFPGELIFDSGFTHKDILEIYIPNRNFDLYLFDHWDIRHIVREFLEITGAPYIPPRWSFGYQQCRYSYPDANTVRLIAAKLREHDIPCDAIYIDIDYMQDYKIFSTDAKRFPDLPGLVTELGEQHIKLIPIIDPGVKVEPGDDVYESGLAGNHFCKSADGKPFTGCVWPGLVHFPDFLNSACRAWWGELYRPFVEMGIEHFWNDMNEPAIFYTPESLELLRATVKQIESTDDLKTKAVDFISSLGQFWQNEADLSRFFHTLDDGTTVGHRSVHNLYGTNMVRGTAEGVRRLKPDQRYFLVARSSYIGMHRYAVIWTGDNASWWEHMHEQMRMMLSLNLAGFFFCGADVGGFGGDSSPELCVRWTQLGCFTPLFRNHSTKGSRAQEPWAFDAESLSIMRDFIRLRYALLPYTYSEFLAAVSELKPFVSPLFLHFGDPCLKDIDDQYMFGESLLVAPIYRQAARGRQVYLPECRWLHWSVRRFEDRFMRVLHPGSHFISAELAELPLFLRENRLIVMQEPTRTANAALPQVLSVLGFVTSAAQYTLHTDDGNSWHTEASQLSTLQLKVQRNHSGFSASAVLHQSALAPLAVREVHFELYDPDGQVHYHRVPVS